MSYVETPTFKDILKMQLLGLENLDKRTLERLYPAMSQVENQLKQELNRYAEDQFSYQKRRQTLILISNSLNKMEKLLLDDFVFSGGEYYQYGLDVGEQEIQRFNAIQAIETPDINKQAISLEHNKFLLNNAEASLKTYSARVRATVSNALTQGMLAGRSGYEITSKLSKFLDIKRWRLQRIVRTESHKIYNSSKLIAYGEFQKQHFPDMMKRLFHPMDKRTADDSKQLAELDPAVPLNKPFVFKYKRGLKTEVRRFMVPPDRPNDRATLIPFRKQWEK